MRRTGAMAAAVLLSTALAQAVNSTVPSESGRSSSGRSSPEAATEEVATHAFDLLETHGELLVLLFSGALMAAFVVGNFLHMHHVSVLPESLVVIGLGFFMANLQGWLPEIPWMTLSQDTILNQRLLSLLLLPIIIFEAGFNMKNREFISQLPYILIIAIFGTVICMAVVAVLIVQTSTLHGVADWRTSFVYGALISAVDPVATLATYAHLNVEPLLSTMVMGESIVNDAVAIVLFRVLNEKPAAYFQKTELWTVGLDIGCGVTGLLCGSIGLGLGLAICYVVTLRFGHMDHTPAMEILFIYFSCFFSYSLAEHVFEMSGIVTVLFQGMLMGAFATPHLTVEGKLLTAFLLKQMATIADMVVFIFVGIGLTFSTYEGLNFGVFVMLACLVGRAAAVLPLGVLTNAIKGYTERKHRNRYQLSWRHLFMMWHAGLRGGIAVVLVLSLGPWVDEETKIKLRNATMLLVCVFLLVFGGTTELFLRWMQIPHGDPPPMHLRKGSCYRFITWLQNRVLTPLLVGDKLSKTHMSGGIARHIIQREGEEGLDGPQMVPTQSVNEAIEGLYGVNPLHKAGTDLKSWLRQRGRYVSEAFQRVTSLSGSGESGSDSDGSDF